ncbi:hypothetical protein RIF29_15784 [Crotalaria pallida]|uniref:Uncharacterized protein n=1 Tax=Crotalaria pallida TaxID=3830 RepID=A0AAN9ICW9_CROPI
MLFFVSSYSVNSFLSSPAIATANSRLHSPPPSPQYTLQDHTLFQNSKSVFLLTKLFLTVIPATFSLSHLFFSL